MRHKLRYDTDGNMADCVYCGKSFNVAFSTSHYEDCEEGAEIVERAALAASNRGDAVIIVEIRPPVTFALTELAIDLDMSVEQVVNHAIKTYQLHHKPGIEPLPPKGPDNERT